MKTNLQPQRIQFDWQLQKENIVSISMDLGNGHTAGIVVIFSRIFRRNADLKEADHREAK